jgi:hypothetical protein
LQSASSGFLSSRSSTSIANNSETLAIGSSLSGQSVTLNAGNDISIEGGRVVAQEKLTMDAGRDLVITSAEERSSADSFHESRRSGFTFGFNGPGYLSSKARDAGEGTSVTQRGSMISGGSVDNCSKKFEAITGAIKALDIAKVLYQDDPASIELIDLQINALMSRITRDEIVRGDAQSISNLDKSVAFTLLSGPALERWLASVRSNAAASGATVGAGGNGLINSALLSEMAANGVKFTPADVVATSRMTNGQVVFMEAGNSKAGLQHIIEQHGDQSAQMGILESQIPEVVMKAVSEGKIIGYQGAGVERPIYEVSIDGQSRRIAVTIGNNGFIVGANPRGSN